jgi:hypothetical protein
MFAPIDVGRPVNLPRWTGRPSSAAGAHRYDGVLRSEVDSPRAKAFRRADGATVMCSLRRNERQHSQKPK